MKASDLQVGDWIRITRIAGEGVPGYQILPETVRVYKKLIARNRPVRIREIDGYGSPWYRCGFKKRNGEWEWHYLNVMDLDRNWELVRRRRENFRNR
jgi:hypothetical protein